MDDVIKRALDEETREKQQRKASKVQKERSLKDHRKGKTLAELEYEEGGPVKESLVGMAQTKRAVKRRGGDVADTDLIENVEQAEEDLEEEEDDGIQLEAFNLKEERRRGYFDEAGNYVENEKNDDAPDDAWLASDEAKVMDAAKRARIEEQQRRFAEAKAAEPLTAVQIARLQWKIAQLLEPGETVTGALKRLGGQQRRKLGKRNNQGDVLGDNAGSTDNKEKFDALTEAASTLLDAGEMDVYEQDRRYFEQCAAVYIDDENVDGLKTNYLARGTSKAAYEDTNEDMFADDDLDKASLLEKPETAVQQDFKKAVVKGGPGKQSLSFDTTGVLEKPELVASAKEHQGSTSAAVGAPPGYAYDTASGMWFSAETGMYWDQKSGGFWNPADNRWYSFSAEEMGAPDVR